MVNQHCTYLCIIHISSTSTENDSDILFSMLQVESGPLKVEKEEDGGGGDGEDGEGGSEKVTEQWIEDKLGRFVHKPAESITQKLQVSREEIRNYVLGLWYSLYWGRGLLIPPLSKIGVRNLYLTVACYFPTG